MIKRNQLPILPKAFVFRVFFLFLLISSIQLFHLSVLAEFNVDNLVVWLCVLIIGSSYILCLYFKLGRCGSWPLVNVRLFSILFVTSFIVTLVFSRVPYLLSFFDKGLYLTRLSGLGGGGIYSYIAILFYPLSILLAFLDLPRRLYYRFVVLMLIIIVIDLLVLGTRGGPFFVLIFHILMLRFNFFTIKTAVILFAGLFFLMLLIDYQTQARSLNTTTVGWDWVRTIRYSWIFDNLKIKDSVILSIESKSVFLFPLLYLSQYITHSIAELNHLLSDGSYTSVGDALYLKDEICLVARCAREAIQVAISEINPRVGLYQTLYSSLLFDFGFLGVMILGVISGTYILFSKVNSMFIAVAVYLVVIMSTSGVENYIYNGLGLARLLIFFMLWKILSLHFRIGSKD